MKTSPALEAPPRAAFLTEARARACAVAIAGIAAASFITIVLWRYAIFRNDVDLGIFAQVIASTASTFSSTAEGGSNHFLVHWSPIIVLGWPFLRAFGPVGLEVLQALLVAAALLPVWGLARARFAPLAALAVTAVAAIYPLLCANAVGDFHEMAFVPLLSALLIFAVDRRRWRLGAAAAVLLACTKEDQFIVLAAGGLILAALGRSDRELRRFGWFAVAISIFFAVVYFGFVRSAIAPHVAYRSVAFFDWSGSNVTLDSLPALLAPRLTLLLLVLAPLAFLPCFSRYGLFLIPGLLIVLASHQPSALLPGEHYVPLLTGYALCAFVDGASRVAGWSTRLAAAAVSCAAAIAIWVAIWDSPMEYWYYLYRTPNAHDAALARVLASLPPDADVGSEDEIFAHLGMNPRASIDMLGQEWFVFDRTHFSQRWHDVDEPAVRRALARHEYAVVSDSDGIVVLHRIAAR